MFRQDDRTRKPDQECLDRTIGQDSQIRTARTEQPEQEGRERTAGAGDSEQDNQNKTAMAGQT
jgi:hypothetical protein